MYKYFMKKSNLILTLFISSLFISTSLDAAVFDLNILKNNQKRDLLIASPGGHGGGGGGGGGKKPKDKKEECIKRSKRAIGFFERQLFDEERLGKSTEKTEKKIKEYKQLLSKCVDTKTPVKKERQKIEIIGGGPNSLAPMKKQKSTIINDYREAIEYNKTDNKLGSAVPLRELRKKVLNLKKKINNIQYKEGDFFEFIDTQYASLYKLDLIESHIILLMSELKKFDDVAARKIPFDKYSPNIKEVEKQQKVLEGLDIQSDKYLSSLNLDFIGLRSLYSRSTLEKMKMLKGTNNQSDDSGTAEAWRKFMKRENER